MKKILFLAAIVLFFITCKKNKTVAPVIDATGTWTLYSWKSDIPLSNLYVTADQYPCMSDNVLIFNKNHAYTSNYMGKDTCYVTHDFNNFPGGLKGTALGISGQPEISGSWHQDGNILYFGSYHGVMSNANGKTALTLNDSISYNGNKYFASTVDIKK
ncbi:MAG: hypothetical protein JWR54_3615 [Mucilaginibacter sp.]|nr:hypothetical protein [Mucilaginibacter sp.]